MSDVVPANLMVLVEGGQACVKISGRANFTASVDFKTLLQELHQAGCRRIELDLTDCVLMDSTFLGVLSGFAAKISTTNGDQKTERIQLYNPSRRILDILENLGVLQLFCVIGSPRKPMDPSRAVTPQSVNPSREEVTRTCLEAHETLMALNPQNASRFKDVARFLAEDLKKMKTGA